MLPKMIKKDINVDLSLLFSFVIDYLKGRKAKKRKKMVKKGRSYNRKLPFLCTLGRIILKMNIL